MVDKRTDDFWLINTPLPVLGIVGLYYYFVTEFGPKFMKDRPPFELKKILIAYNIGQILLNGYIFIQVQYAVLRINKNSLSFTSFRSYSIIIDLMSGAHL